VYTALNIWVKFDQLKKFDTFSRGKIVGIVDSKFQLRKWNVAANQSPSEFKLKRKQADLFFSN
jgi:hypothetical protein